MAKWGEGDPRWFVEYRGVVKNLSDWHWSEKNAKEWLRYTIKRFIFKLDGEATIVARKRNVIVFYKWDLEMDWKSDDIFEKLYQSCSLQYTIQLRDSYPSLPESLYKV